jgi:predicted nucleic acid-binding protein
MYVLDTDWGIQALGNRQPAPRILDRLAGSRIFVSYIALGDFYERSFRSVNPDAHLVNVRHFLATYHALTLTEPVMLRFAELRAGLRRRGQLISDFDLLIAATALDHDLTLLTFNRRDFQRVPDLKLYQPS